MDAIELPFAADGINFVKNPNEAFGPSGPSFRHVCNEEATGQSASNTLSNGNLFVALSQFYMYEVDVNEETVWQYPEGPQKGFRYECNYPGIQSLIQNGYIDDLCDHVSVSETQEFDILITPNPFNGDFHIKGLDQTAIQNIHIYDLSGRQIAYDKNENRISILECNSSIYILHLVLNNGRQLTTKISSLRH